MDWFGPNTLVTVGVQIFLTAILIVNLPRMLSFLQAQHDMVERRFGDRVRQFKYDCLVPWVDRIIPVSADVITLSRLLFVGGSLICFHLDILPAVMPLYITGWTTDYLDGLKAYAETQRRGQATPHGKYLDPSVDMLCFACQAFALNTYYTSNVMWCFIGAIGARTLLFVSLLCGRLLFESWRHKMSSGILPKTITGEVKAALIAFSFGLVLFDRQNQVSLLWANRLLVLAVVFEGLTLSYLVHRAIRGDFAQRQLTLIVSPQKTGSE